MEDKYHTPEQRRNNKGSEIYEIAVRANATLDDIVEDQTTLSFNLINCGAQLEQFVCSLSRIIQWDPLLARASVFSVDKRQGFVFLFAQILLGALDYADDPLEYRFMDCPLASVSAMFLQQYFNKLSPQVFQWFTPTS